MKRILVGTAALVAAAVLCIGGSTGSMASWQAEATTESAAFTMGTLEMKTAPGTWTMDGEAISESSRAVPGSTLVYTQVFTLTLEGDGLAARVTVDPGALSRTGTFVAGDVALSAPAVRDGDGWLVTAGGTLTLTLPFSWPKGTSIDDSAQNVELTIDPSELLVVQEVPR